MPRLIYMKFALTTYTPRPDICGSRNLYGLRRQRCAIFVYGFFHLLYLFVPIGTNRSSLVFRNSADRNQTHPQKYSSFYFIGPHIFPFRISDSEYKKNADKICSTFFKMANLQLVCSIYFFPAVVTAENILWFLYIYKVAVTFLDLFLYLSSSYFRRTKQSVCCRVVIFYLLKNGKRKFNVFILSGFVLEVNIGVLGNYD